MSKNILFWSKYLFLLMLLISVVLVAWFWPRYPYDDQTQPRLSIERLDKEAIISAYTHPSLSAAKSEHGYANFSGPSLIRVPSWVEQPLGMYYLYFAHHNGDHIRMAYADSLNGPWQLYEPGVFHIDQSGFPTEKDHTWKNNAVSDLGKVFSAHVVRDYMIMARRTFGPDAKIRKERGLPAAQNSTPHIASPDVIVDNEQQQIKMYYHGQGKHGYQYTRSALSSTGLSFDSTAEIIASPYVRSFRIDNIEYLLAMPGVLFRKNVASKEFEPRDRLLFDPNMRHAAVVVSNDVLHVFWSRVGDVPESILHSTVSLSNDNWNTWRATEAVTVLSPALSWEGGNLPALASFRGEGYAPANDLRDPAIFVDENGQTYLLYSAGGEQAIGIAKISFDP